MAKNKGKPFAGKAPGGPKKTGGVQKGKAPGGPKNKGPRGIKGAPSKVIKVSIPNKPSNNNKPQSRHTILLQQKSAAPATRSWSDYANLAQAIDSFITSYEATLRALNPNLKQLTYSVADLHKYVDSLYDISLMIADPVTKQYAPKGKDFLKTGILNKLKSAAA